MCSIDSYSTALLITGNGVHLGSMIGNTRVVGHCLTSHGIGRTFCADNDILVADILNICIIFVIPTAWQGCGAVCR